jgi:hypothetical protein
MRDADIDDSDIPRLDKSFWKTVKLTMAELKDRLTIRATMTLSNDSRRPEGLPDPHQRHLALLHEGPIGTFARGAKDGAPR